MLMNAALLHLCSLCNKSIFSKTTQFIRLLFVSIWIVTFFYHGQLYKNHSYIEILLYMCICFLGVIWLGETGCAILLKKINKLCKELMLHNFTNIWYFAILFVVNLINMKSYFTFVLISISIT